MTFRWLRWPWIVSGRRYRRTLAELEVLQNRLIQVGDENLRKLAQIRDTHAAELERLGQIHGQQLMQLYRAHDGDLQKLKDEHEAERRAHEETKQKHHNLQLQAVVHFRYMKRGIPTAFRTHIPRDMAAEHNAHWQGEPVLPATNSIARPAHDWP